MTANRSIVEVLASLEAQTAFHREREAFHAKHEKSHREQRELHGAELEGRIFLVRPGKPHWEALYMRERPPAPSKPAVGSA